MVHLTPLRQLALFGHVGHHFIQIVFRLRVTVRVTLRLRIGRLRGYVTVRLSLESRNLLTTSNLQSLRTCHRSP